MLNQDSVGQFVRMAIFVQLATCCSLAMARAPSVVLKAEPGVHETGQPVVVSESAKLPSGYVVQSISHKVTRIGIYHKKREQFIRWHGSILPARNRDYPQALMAPHGIQLEEDKDGRSIKRFQFEFIDPGIYQIDVTWTLTPRSPGEQAIVKYSGTPVVLYVEPDENDVFTASTRTGNDDGLEHQQRLEDAYDANPDEVGQVVAVPKGDGESGK